MRWDLIDRFEILKRDSRALAWKNFSGNEDFFRDHFPGSPRLPQTLMIEMIAQAGGVLFGLGIDFRKEVILAKIAEARFFKEVPPPCQFRVEATIEDQREEGAWILGRVFEKDETVAEAKMLLVSMESLGENGKRNIVFNPSFLKHYDIYNVAKRSESLA